MSPLIYKEQENILSMQVTDEHVHDGKLLPTLVDDLVKSNGWNWTNF